jgi:hypothetical protein
VTRNYDDDDNNNNNSFNTVITTARWPIIGKHKPNNTKER